MLLRIDGQCDPGIAELVHGLVLGHNPLFAFFLLSDREQFRVCVLLIANIAAFTAIAQDTQRRRIFPLH